MSVFKNMLFVFLFAVLTISAFGWQWLYQKSHNVSKQELLTKIDHGYTSQFCNVIFPHIADCVTLPRTGCEDFAQQTLARCTTDLVNSTEANISNIKAREVYNSMAACFELNSHSELLIHYVKDTRECKQKLS